MKLQNSTEKTLYDIYTDLLFFIMMKLVQDLLNIVITATHQITFKIAINSIKILKNSHAIILLAFDKF